jgi:hypothetical protein
MDSVEITKAMVQQERKETVPYNWKENQHLETDFVNHAAMDVQVEVDKVDQPHSQRMFGTPVYDQHGDMRCRCCGGVMGRSTTNGGEAIAACSDVGCKANGFAYAEGSYVYNPHRARIS